MFHAAMCANGEMSKQPGRLVIPDGGAFPDTDHDFMNVVALIVTETVVAPGTILPVCLGSTDVGVLCNGIPSPDRSRIDEIGNMANVMADALRAAVQQAQGTEKAYFEALLADAERNGCTGN